MRNFRKWLSWEFCRKVEPSKVLTLIAIERFIKGGFLLAAGFVLAFLSSDHTLTHLAHQWQYQLNLNSQGDWWREFYQHAVIKFGYMPQGKQFVIAAGAALYGVLEILEGIGLLCRRRWAEYLVLIATGAFLPLEIIELLKGFTVLRASALLVNLFIIVYLVWRKRLFLERPDHQL